MTSRRTGVATLTGVAPSGSLLPRTHWLPTVLPLYRRKATTGWCASRVLQQIQGLFKVLPRSAEHSGTYLARLGRGNAIEPREGSCCD